MRWVLDWCLRLIFIQLNIQVIGFYRVSVLFLTLTDVDSWHFVGLHKVSLQARSPIAVNECIVLYNATKLIANCIDTFKCNCATQLTLRIWRNQLKLGDVLDYIIESLCLTAIKVVLKRRLYIYEKWFIKSCHISHFRKQNKSAVAIGAILVMKTIAKKIACYWTKIKTRTNGEGINENEIEKVACRTNKNQNDCMAKKLKLKWQKLMTTFFDGSSAKLITCNSVAAAVAVP